MAISLASLRQTTTLTPPRTARWIAECLAGFEARISEPPLHPPSKHL